MERLFKKGDLVECVDNSWYQELLTKGKIYEVFDLNGDIVHVRFDDGIFRHFKPFRFKLHKAAEEQPSWELFAHDEQHPRDFFAAEDGTQYQLRDDQPEQVDIVNNPPHYKQGSVECIEAIKAALTEEEFRGYCKGNAIKYIWREKHKGGKESIEKANWYLNKL